MNRRVITGIAAVAIGLVCLAIGFWPFKQVPFEVPVTLSSGQKAILSGSMPSKAWVGEKYDLDLSLKLISPSDTSKGHLQASVDMAGVEVSPQGHVSLTFDPTKAVDLTWKITPLTPGILTGTLWVYAGAGSLPENAILARDYQVDAITFLGITARWYRWVGIGFLAIGAFLILAFSRIHFEKRKSTKKRARTLKIAK